MQCHVPTVPPGFQVHPTLVVCESLDFRTSKCTAAVEAEALLCGFPSHQRPTVIGVTCHHFFGRMQCLANALPVPHSDVQQQMQDLNLGRCQW